MDAQFIKEVSRRIVNVPPLPSVAMKLIALAGDPNVELEEIDAVVSSDQSLAIRVLQIANSPFYGASYRIASIAQAVMLIGFRSLRNLALGLSVMKVANGEAGSKLNLETFWKHSLATAIAARGLSAANGQKHPDEAFTAGLIHDIGKIILMREAGDAYSIAQEGPHRSIVTIDHLEHEVFEMDHAELGGELCRHWHIPEEIADAVSGHHSFEPESVTSASLHKPAGLVFVADQLAKIAGFGSGHDDAVDLLFTDMLAKSKFRTDDFVGILNGIHQEMSHIRAFFGLAPSSLEEEANAASGFDLTRWTDTYRLEGKRLISVAEISI